MEIVHNLTDPITEMTVAHNMGPEIISHQYSLVMQVKTI